MGKYTNQLKGRIEGGIKKTWNRRCRDRRVDEEGGCDLWETRFALVILIAWNISCYVIAVKEQTLPQGWAPSILESHTAFRDKD